MKVDDVEKDYWWEIRTYFEEPTKENLVELLELVYEEAYKQGAYDGSYDD